MPVHGIMCQACVGTGLVHPAANTDKVCEDCGGKGVLPLSPENISAATQQTLEQPVSPEIQTEPVPLESGGNSGSETVSAESTPE